MAEAKEANNASNDKANDVDDEKKPDGPAILIMGGCGFIGRHLVQLLASTNLQIVVSDKLIPQTAYMTAALVALYKKRVTVIHSDLSKPHHIQKVFVDSGFDFEFIINLCGETRFGQSDQDYKVKCLETCKKSMIAASNCKNLKLWLEVSTAMVYEPAKKPLSEKAKTAPFTRMAEYRLQCEQLIQKSGLPFVILRPSMVYGPGDKTGLTPRLVSAACYKHEGSTMKFLWTPNLAVNTVHVRDLCRAIWLCCEKAAKAKGSVFNVSDRGNTTQGKLNPVLEQVFGIKCGFMNAAVNKAAKNMMANVAQHSNDKHVPMWSDLCKAYHIESSPLTPYIDQEILTKNYLCIDGQRIEKELGFKYEYPVLDARYVHEVIEEYVHQGYFPDLKQMKAKK